VADAGVDRLLERPNLGYAAGLNAGAAEARGEVLLLANPDIRFFEGSLERLLAGLEAGFDVVGPQFVWDAEGSVFLPPAEDPAPISEIGRSLRRRWSWCWSKGLPREIEASWRVWAADSTLPVNSLRGALLVLRAEALDRYGPLDEGYFLYYEETECASASRRGRWCNTGGGTPPHRTTTLSRSSNDRGNVSSTETITRSRAGCCGPPRVAISDRRLRSHHWPTPRRSRTSRRICGSRRPAPISCRPLAVFGRRGCQRVLSISVAPGDGWWWRWCVMGRRGELPAPGRGQARGGGGTGFSSLP